MIRDAAYLKKNISGLLGEEERNQCLERGFENVLVDYRFGFCITRHARSVLSLCAFQLPFLNFREELHQRGRSAHSLWFPIRTQGSAGWFF